MALFDSNLNNLIAIVTVAGVVLILYVLISRWKQPASSSGLLSESQENLTGIAAYLLSGSSVSLSIAFAMILAFNPMMTFVFVAMFTGFAIIEFISSFHLARNWRTRRLGGVFFSIWMLLGGVAISILAGQSVLHIAEQRAKLEQARQSEEYARLLARQEAANAEVKRLALPATQVIQARAQLAQEQAQLEALTTQRDNLQAKLNACPENYFKKCIDPTQAQINRINQQLAKVQGQLAQNQALITQNEQYQAAKVHANELNSQTLEDVKTSNASQGIEALAIVLGTQAQIVSAYAFLYLAIFCELSALIAFYLWGQSRYERALVSGRTFDYNEYANPKNSTQNVWPSQKKVIETMDLASTPSKVTTQNVLSNRLKTIFEQVKRDLISGLFDNPSFKRLQTGYQVTQSQAHQIRQQLLLEKVCVKDSTGKLVAVR